MKVKWNEKPLGELFKTGSGGTPLKSKKEYYEGGTIPWILSGEVSQGEIRVAKNFITKNGIENSAAKIFPKNTVLVAMYGATAGQVGVLRIEATTNQAICGILPNGKFLPEFLFYFLQDKRDELIAQATGNAQPNISQIKIKNTLVPIVSLPELKHIVAILDKAFDGIAKAKTNAEKNLKNARAVFESYLNEVFSKRGKDWKIKSISKLVNEGFIAKPQDGNHGEIHPIKADFVEKGIPFIMAADLEDGVVNTRSCRFIKEAQALTLRIGFAKSGDVVMFLRQTLDMSF